MCDSFQNKILMQKNLSFIVSKILVCARMPVHAYSCIKHVHASLEHTCAYACMRTHAVRFLWPFFSKNSIFVSYKSYIFSENTFLKSISIWLSPKWILGIKILTSFRNGGPSSKRYKMRCLPQWPPFSKEKMFSKSLLFKTLKSLPKRKFLFIYFFLKNPFSSFQKWFLLCKKLFFFFWNPVLNRKGFDLKKKITPCFLQD